MEFVDYLKRPDKYKVNNVAHLFFILYNKNVTKRHTINLSETLFIFLF